ncbi:I78 family peptidase inhibitor [Pararhodobacter zhoushanensis]|uniref:I78 family peptidase inhibitor n=1 Tax=Pararhodobacter zhoushanensis TaxID=2479545 RepID=A0ABT3GUI5_9RHOB|nr:I78 family peptidase inhibitor [Pararhodobacter zhoushanensis]MCW1931190.1 I78 family peptidase inhibitor [Pararhodobacter zhoushanensis]
MPPLSSGPYYRPAPPMEPVVPDVPPLSPPMAEPPRVTPPVAPISTDPSDTCGANSLQHFVGSVAPQPFPAPGPVRVIGQGDPVTMDHNPQRLNVTVDRETRRRVVSLSCG